uniref:Uncharacterized protein AlNc14C29G2777 n=1 Tax=Albugo laibachii Nc14 TaxID=890382 RepID=F0W7G4_9STRA|nr:conserved hypothetical protein [Albugo laibachii Nc14]|eukprot:CCA17065.1 conserved hypothetical protein [Albugo laibachii Nc14]
MRAKKEKVPRHWIQASARELAPAELDDEDFSASDKWLAHFMDRYGLSLRRATNLTVLSDDELTARVVQFLAYLSSKRIVLNRSTTLLMDETAVFFEDPRRDTVDITGTRHVVLHSKAFASMQITVVLTVSATGKNLPPLLICKGVKQSIQKRGAFYVAPQE